ncbi:hypothetical protein JXA88_17050 [Candidatus Fermentibacteria bacterium]|nr:hypothetical protein [Candidatus Fermentibacteria bacterium]
MSLRILLCVCAMLSISLAAEQWQPLNGPLGGDVRCMAVDRSDPSSVYLGLGTHASMGSEYADGGGLFYSNDAGDSWRRSSLQNVKVSGITTAAGRIWAATYGEGVWAAVEPSGAWIPENSGLGSPTVLCITGTADHLVVGTMAGVFHAHPDTAVWVPAEMPGERQIWGLASAPWLPELMLAATDSGVWRSDTGGDVWSFAGTGIEQTNLRSIAVGADGRCWAGSRPGSNQDAVVYCSADTGRTWAPCAPLPASRADGVWSILPRPESVLIGIGWLGSGMGRVFRLRDGAAEWEEHASVHYRSVRALTEVPAGGDRILAGGESCGGVLCSTDGGDTWGYRLTGLDAGNVYSLRIVDSASGTIMAGLGFSGALARADEWGASWTRVDSLFPSLFVRGLAVHPSNPETLYAAAWNRLYRSTNGGESWASMSASVSQATGIDLSAADPSIIYAGATQGVSVSQDGGDTWSDPDSTLPGTVKAVVADPRNARHALAAREWSHVYETFDAGVSWDTLAIQSCRTLALHPTDPQWIYAGANGGVYVSIDGGATFQFLTSGLPGLWVNAIIADPQDPAVIWAGTPGGVYKSIDGGQTWHFNSDGMANLDVRAFEFHDESRRIFVGSHSGGVHWAFADATPTDGNSPGTPQPLALRLQVSPVPCVDEVRISLLGEVGPDNGVRVALYSLDGRRMHSGGFGPGNSCVWRLGHLPAGSYVLRAESSSAKASQALTLVR